MPVNTRVIDLTRAAVAADLARMRAEHLAQLQDIAEDPRRRGAHMRSRTHGRSIAAEIGRTYRVRARAIGDALDQSLRFQDAPVTVDELVATFTELFEPERSDALENSRRRLVEIRDGSFINDLVTDANLLIQQFRVRAEHIVADRDRGAVERSRYHGEGKIHEETDTLQAARLMELLQLYETDAASTAVLIDVSHDRLVEAFNRFLFHHGSYFGIQGWGDHTQSLRDRGVDAIWRRGAQRWGFQVKSHGDFSREESFQRTVFAQITSSRQMDLTCLFVAMGADLTNGSQAQKARGLISEIESMSDAYVYAISAEKTAGVWRWHCGTNLGAVEQLVDAGYAWLTLVYDTRGNRNQNSWGKSQGGGWSHPKSTTLRAGDTVTISAVAMCPNDATPEFQFAVQPSGRSFLVRQDWSRASDWTWRVGTEDIGRDVVVKVAVRRPKSYFQFGDADDYTYAVYDVLPSKSTKASGAD